MCLKRGEEIMVGDEFRDGGERPYPPRKEIGTLKYHVEPLTSFEQWSDMI